MKNALLVAVQQPADVRRMLDPHDENHRRDDPKTRRLERFRAHSEDVDRHGQRCRAEQAAHRHDAPSGRKCKQKDDSAHTEREGLQGAEDARRRGDALAAAKAQIDREHVAHDRGHAAQRGPQGRRLRAVVRCQPGEPQRSHDALRHIENQHR